MLLEAYFFYFPLFPILFFIQNWNNNNVLGNLIFLTDDGWKYQVVTEAAPTMLFLYNTWVGIAFVLFSACFYIAYKKETHVERRHWKKILFIFFTIAPLLVFYRFHLSTTQATHNAGNYTISFYLFLLLIGLTRIFSNFRLFEVGPVKALDNILNSMSNLVIITDNQLNVAYYNTALQQLFCDKKEAHFKGVNLITILRKRSIIRAGVDDAKQTIEQINKLGFQERIERDITLYISGEVHSYLFIVSPIYHKKEIKTGFSFIGIDLTRIKESEIQLRKYAEQLEKSNRELERFAYVASHDLKTPLRNVISFLSLIKRKAKNMGSEIDDYLRFASTNAKNMYNLIEDILEFSRVRNPQNEQWEIIDLNQVIALVRQNLSHHLKDKNIIIECETLPTIQANPAQMLQIFQNLIENGLKYNKNEFPMVNITCTTTPDGECRFYIQDNGIGIAPEYQDTIFELFKRLHTQSEYPGSGLGLAISKKIAEQYGGDITLASSPGNGSTFTITFRNIYAYFDDESCKYHQLTEQLQS